MNLQLTIDKVAHLLLVGCVSWVLSGLFGFLGLLDGWVSFILIWLAGGTCLLILAAQRVSTKGKAVLITGCDSGFGHSLALHLNRIGFRVFAGCLLADKDGEGAKSLKETGSKRLHVIQMDVTNEDELKSVRKTVEKLLPNDEVLWGVVNNAGRSTFGNVEWVPVSTYKRMNEVNIYAMVNVTKVFLPLIRKSKGRVVNVASVLGRIGAPMRAPYACGKFAVEAFSDCLRQEMKRCGVKVVIMEPGKFVAGTNIFTAESVQRDGDQMWDALSDETRSFYDEKEFRNLVQSWKKYVSTGDTSLQLAIDAFTDALTQKYPQARYQPMDIYFKTRIFIWTHLPEWFYDAIYV